MDERSKKTIISKKKAQQPFNIAVLSNITLEPYFVRLINGQFSHRNVLVNVTDVDYSDFFNENCEALKNSDMIVVLLNFESFYPNIYNDFLQNKISEQDIKTKESKRFLQVCTWLKEQTKAKILWFGYENYGYDYRKVMGNILSLSRLIDEINEGFIKTDSFDITFIDMKRIIASIGINQTFNTRGKYRWNAPYSDVMIKQICSEVYKQYLILYGVSKKCIILDCDNVLWGGVVSEVGIKNVKLGDFGFGRPYQDFQRYLIYLYLHGVILAICSKNELEDVLCMFREHTGMLLKEEYVACFQVNWENKTDNIKKISELLNIGLDSIVFVDDSDFEIESVKAMLPEVLAIKFKYDSIYDKLSCFNLRENVCNEEINNRNNTYKTNEKRTELRKQYETYDDYLKALEMKLDIHQVVPMEFARVSELTLRANKCTNGIRYTIDDIEHEMRKDGYKLYTVSLSDRFSNLGVVGAFAIDLNELSMFCLSCRALGRGVENQIFEFIQKQHNIKTIIFRFTNKNDGLKQLMQKSFGETTKFEP